MKVQNKNKLFVVENDNFELSTSNSFINLPKQQYIIFYSEYYYCIRKGMQFHYPLVYEQLLHIHIYKSAQYSFHYVQIFIIRSR